MICFYLEVKMENQINVGNQNDQQIGQNPINQSTTPSVGSRLNYRLLLPTLLALLFFGIMGLLIINLQSKKGQDQIDQSVGQPESIPSPDSRSTKEFTLISPSGKKTIFFKQNRWGILYEDKEYLLYLLPFPAGKDVRVEEMEKCLTLPAPNIEPCVEFEGKRRFRWSSDEKYLFAYLPSLSDNPPKYIGKFMLVSLLPKNIEIVWEKTIETEDTMKGDYFFQGAIFSSSNKLYLTYEKSPSRTISVIDPSIQREKERVIKKETFERGGFLASWEPINISPKESYLLILQAYEFVDEPLFLLNTKTGELIDIQITINIENRDFAWNNDEKSVVFTYERYEDNFGYEFGKVRYNLENNRLEFLGSKKFSRTGRGRNTPEAVTEDFYNWYMGCWTKHQQRMVPGDASKDCSYENSEYVSGDLSQNLKDRNNTIMCAQDFPVRITVDKAVVIGTNASVIAHHIYEISGDNPITVNLKFIEDTWKISDIICQKR